MRASALRLAVGLTAAAAAPAAAQGGSPTLGVTLVQDQVPRVQTTNLLADGQFVALMRSGFPLRLHYRLELWRVRANWFDQFVREVQWDAVAHHDPLADDFVLIRNDGSVSRYATPEQLARALEIPYTITLSPPSSRSSFYFLCRLEVSTLNDTDLEELSRWLRGDVGPAVSGEGNLGNALARGAQRVLVRLAGLPRLRMEGRSPTFRSAAR